MLDERNESTAVDPCEESIEMPVSPFVKGLAGIASFGASLRSAAILHIAKKLNHPNSTFAKTAFGKTVRSAADIGAHIEIAKMGCDFITTLAEQIDGLFAKGDKEEYAVEEDVEEPVEEVAEEVAPVEEAPVEEAPVAVEAFASVEENTESEDENEDEDEDSLPEGLASMKLDYIDVMEEPEKYKEMLEQEANGEVMLVTRYRRSFRSRMIQSQGNVQDYYSELKNQLLSYKGVKGRVSWGNESFNRGRSYVAKVNAKTRTLYVYLAIDPAKLADANYEVVDVSSKKKYAAVPSLIKVRGDRKFKFVSELIRQICEEEMALPPVKNFEAEDYRVPFSNTEDLGAEGLVKKMVAAVPVVKEA